jgi:hypothetical protein
MDDRDALVAVFPTDSWPAVAASLERSGVAMASLRVDHPDDVRLTLHAEQREEADRSVFSPQAGVLLTKEGAKAAGLGVPVAALVGALVMLPFALIPFGDLEWWWRALWLAIIGAFGGGTIGFIATGAMAVKDPYEPSLVDRGVVVRADGPDPNLALLLARLEPIRLDRIGADGTVVRLVTEEDRTSGGVVEETLANIRREARVDRHRRHR